MSTRRRILFVDETSSIAGGTNSLLLLLQKLDKEKYEPILLAPDGPFVESARRMNIATCVYGFKYLRLTNKLFDHMIPNPILLFYRLQDAFYISKLIRDRCISLIHSNTLNAHITSSFARRISRIPVIWHVRRMYNFSSLLYRGVWLPERIIFVSRSAMERAFGPKGHPKACVVHNGIDLESFRRDLKAYREVRRDFGLASDEKIVGSVGRLDPGKGYEYFIQAARAVLNMGIRARFMIVGDYQYDGGYARSLLSLVADLNMKDEVIFAGFQSNVSRLASAFDVFVSPSVRDAHPRVVLEGMALSLPIVGTESGGIAETVQHGKSGLLVPVRDGQGLANAIVQVLSDPELAARLGKNGYNRVMKLFSARGYAKKVERIYDSVLNEIANRN